MQTTNTAEIRRASDARARTEKLIDLWSALDNLSEDAGEFVRRDLQAQIDELNVAAARSMGLLVG